MTTGIRKPGQFCWINVLTPEPPAARDFFGKLLGWTYQELPGIGHIIHLGGQEIGGLWDQKGPNVPAGTPAAIGVMVKVESADATARKVTAMGGDARAPMDVMDQGRMVVCHDPLGAQFDVWEARRGPGMAVDGRTHGAPSWFELMTTDTARSAKFYSEVFGWTAADSQMPHMVYTEFKLGDEMVGGMMAITAEVGKMPPNWLTYFTVTDVDQSTKQAAETGATVFVPPTDIPNVGRFSCLNSPQGVMFYLLSYAS